MKISQRAIALVAGLAILIFTGCKKETSYYPSQANLNDFSGTWNGSLSTFKNNHTVTLEGSIVFYFPYNSDRLEGIMTLDKVYALTEIQIRNGIYYFQVLNSDTLNPFCQNWNLSGWAQLGSAAMMHVAISGKECGEAGEEWVNYEGDFTLASPAPDSSRYFSFPGTDRHWIYRILTAGGDTCQLDQVMDSVYGSVFSGYLSTSCDLSWGAKPFRWNITPMHLMVLNNYSGNQVQYGFHVDQGLNVPYYYFPGGDTNIVTLLGTDSIYVQAGGFLCSKYRLEQRMHTDTSYLVDIGIIYISNQYGVIRYQATLVNSTEDFLDQELTQKNF